MGKQWWNQIQGLATGDYTYHGASKVSLGDCNLANNGIGFEELGPSAWPLGLRKYNALIEILEIRQSVGVVCHGLRKLVLQVRGMLL